MRTFLLLFFLLLFSQPLFADDLMDSVCNANSHCVALDQGKDRALLCYFRNEDLGEVWILDRGSSQRFLLEDAPSLGTSGLLYSSLSPSGKYLAITSASEGHPEITVFDLGNLLSKREMKAVLFITPYPGYIEVKGWDGERLTVLSDQDITSSKNPSPDELFKEPKAFSVNVATGAISPIP